MTNDNVAKSLLLTFDGFLTVSTLFLFLFEYLLKNNIKLLKWSSKVKIKRKRRRFEVIVFCKISVLHD